MEILGTKRPIFDSLDTLRGSYNSTINRAKDIVSKEKLTTSEGRFILTFLLATGNLISSLGPELSEVKYGEPETAEKEIDLIGGEVADILLPGFIAGNRGMGGTEIYIEERKKWEAHPQFAKALSGENARMILVDPCDETTSPSYRSVGISIFDKEGKFLSGGVAGIEDKVVVFIEGNRVSSVGFDGGKNVDNDPLYINFAPGAPENIRVATLGRRAKDEDGFWDLLRKISPNGYSVFQTFGGCALIKMLRGEIDAMIDIYKGQPWYEAAQWGGLAEKLGFSVQYGDKIPSAQVIISQPTPARIKLLISRNKEIHSKILENIGAA